ncbi:ABC transporter permease subunit [Pseudoflavitalea sp. G-6-1-2]|uniref:ABC transporter permease n=1 Tax=Pseudoflavitalea sp. G-6-1-2 TaxID=2728841 RepID=UPI00146ED711|nr:ABC transporter permease [Pseudoflavitalea sp. G-6-1-2]NML22767.1 ABC transporter permease subunit [Pseudoflavitalea sp. G-6-1-2]
MASFIINTKAELLKSRRTLAYRVAFFGGISLPVLYMLGYILRPDIFTKSLSQFPWEAHLKNCWEIGAAFFPMFVVILTSLVVQTEYRNNTWKNVYTQPRSNADIFFSKFVVIQLLLLAALLLFDLSLLATGYVSNMIHGAYGFFSIPPSFDKIIHISTHIYLSSLGLAALQYWLSLRFKNYITSMGIGIGMTIVVFMIFQWNKSIYFPYAHPLLTYFLDSKKELVYYAGVAKHEWYSIIYAAVLLPLGFWNMVTRKERG